ncbi:MAG TPA: glycine cleavage system aminomethyltransferase GcvT, partial [Gammaproteobacteria bacterium]|nr:glycine cleavage system aminomethyltransferase GcvT [Gammaproteobacteria bacterium]
SKLKNPGTALYSCLLNYEGNILDDLITYKFNQNDFVLIINASQSQKDLNWFIDHKPNHVHIESKSNWSLIALQGPQSRETLSRLYPKHRNQLATLKPFHFFSLEKLTIACTGYTGEDGFEIMGETADLLALWHNLQNVSVPAVGLGARDSLRLEAGLNLYGQDMDETTTPFESNLGWTVDFNDPTRNFIGKDALTKQKSLQIPRKLIGLLVQDAGVLRAHMAVELDQNPALQGVVTSGSFSPILKSSIAFARIPNVAFTQCHVKIRNTWHPAQATTLPFVRLGKVLVQINPLHS